VHDRLQMRAQRLEVQVAVKDGQSPLVHAGLHAQVSKPAAVQHHSDVE